jgi:prophage regulatory protein
MNNEGVAAPARVLRWRAVCERIGLSRATLWRMVRAGQFPQPFPLASESSVGWLASEIDAWIAARAASRTTKKATQTAAATPGHAHTNA